MRNVAQELDKRTSLVETFGVASAFVVLGVLASWWYVARSSEPLSLHLPELETLTAPALTDAMAVDEDWLSLADAAMAAGRVVEPEGDNALHFYERAAQEAALKATASAGIGRVVAYLVNEIESAVYRNDWPAAQELMQRAQSVRAGDPELASLSARIESESRVAELTLLALGQLEKNHLTKPEGDNALKTYRDILEIDPDNATARKGIESISQRFLSSAQSAALADNHAVAASYLTKAQAVDPNASGLEETLKLTKQWKATAIDQSAQSLLLAASDALSDNRLVQPKGRNALSLFRQVLVRDPDSQAAQQGIALVQQALVDRTWNQLRAQDLVAARSSLADVRRAGASRDAVRELATELAYRQKLTAAQNGQFERLINVRDLKLEDQVAPEFPRRADEDGWVKVQFTVTTDGSVADATVAESSSAAFDEAALAAIRKWRFAPYMEDGRPLPVRSEIKFSFRHQ